MEGEVDLVELWQVIWRRKRQILLVVLVITFCSAIISLFLPKEYKAEATLMPVGGQKGGAGLAMAQLLGLPSVVGEIGGGSSLSGQILAILNSRTLAERVIEKYQLMPILFPEIWDRENQRWKVDEGRIPPMESGVKVLFSKVTFRDDRKSQLVRITAVWGDSKMSAGVVNGYIKELASHIQENAFTGAKRYRIFIEDQLERNKADLLTSGKELAEFYAAKQISNVQPKLDVDISVAPQMSKPDRQEVLVGEGAGNMKSERSLEFLPIVPEALAETHSGLDKIKEQVQTVETKIKGTRIVHDIPQQVYLQYLTLRGELLKQVNSLLTQQYEMAKIEEAKEDLNFQVIDWARVPIKKFKPKRAQIVLISFFMSLFLSLPLAFLMEFVEKNKARLTQK